MDKLFIYIFAAWTVTHWAPIIRGDKAGDLEIGLALRQSQPAKVIAQKNGELVLNCTVEYNTDLGELTLNWTKDGAPVVYDRRVQKLENGSLFIRRIIHRPRKNWTDEGRYKCFGTIKKGSENVGRVIARDVLVQASGMEKKFIIEPQPQTVPIGGVARFQCQIQAIPPAMYEWQRDKTVLPQNDRYLVLNSGILQITGVIETDAGVYRCYATQGLLHELPGHDIDVKYSEEAELTVVPDRVGKEIKIFSSTKNTTVLVRKPALLECLVQGYTGKVEWRKGDNKQLVKESSRIERIGNNLRFVETEKSDSGKYECVAGNVRSPMMLNVIRKPVITDLTSGQRVPMAQWIYMECHADGDPKPRITWYKDGEKIDFNNNYNYKNPKENQLAITLSQQYNSGYYQCVASNEAGSVSALTRVQVFKQEHSPNKPTNLTAVDVTSTSILLTWQPAEAATNHRILAYTVHYRRDGGPRDEVVTTRTEISLENLSPYSNYIIYVTAYSSTGQGPASENLVVRTAEDKPSRPPMVTLEPQVRAIEVTWQPLPVKYNNGIITQYQIFVRQSGSPSTEVIKTGISGTATSHLITGLEPETEYEVRMLAGTSVGFRERFPEELWPWVSVTTLSDSYIIAPNVQILPLNNTAINVTWTYADMFSVKQFVVQLEEIPTRSILKKETLAAIQRYTIFSQLDKNAVYEVKVVVHTINGLKSEAVEEFSSLDVLKAPGPVNLNVVTRSPDSISLEWEEPTADIEIMYFTVRYQQVGTTNYKFVNSNTNSALLENLKPFTEYEISVRANGEKLVSEYSDTLKVYTESGLPSEPLSVQIQTVKPGKILVNWLPPAQPNGQIKSYTIMYTDVPSETDDLWIRVEKNGSENSAQITISDTSGQLYYFKLHASTDVGAGKTTPQFPVNPSETATPGSSADSKKEDKKLGIIIGISIGVFCIIICVIIILLRQKCYGSSNNQQPQTQPARYHGNGHIPGNGNGHAIYMQESHATVGGVLEMDAYTPMLNHLPENEQSDSKGGGDSNVILTPNGAKLNGFPLKHNGILNGQIQNGHMTSLLDSQYKEKSGLLAAMMSGGHEPCMAHVEEEGFPTSRSEDFGSLDNIDTGSSEDVIHKISGKELENSGEDSGEGSLTASNRTSSEYGSSIPRSDTTDTGDTVVHCGSSSRHDTGLGGELYTGERDRNDLPINIPQSSPMCEDTCHDGGTSLNVQESRAVSGSVLPHDGDVTVSFSPPTIATSNSLSQAIRKTDTSGAGEPCQVARNEHDTAVPQVICNGSPPGISAQSERRRHPASNGVPPQMYAPTVVNRFPVNSNGIPPQMNTADNVVICRPQGHFNRLSSAENNPNQSQTSNGAEIFVDSTIPQETRRSTKHDASPRNGHFQI
ncbi:protogenin-like isoform X2 [Ruditapes philippinarum]|uniref:protogenin-like isoform X2 n=1 Tax=Ruditapes philippinarum TaxID=129788 RepID=UPI00295A9184|nr:protogenin-like isoform X2 [Ruditapes philippinarum]